MLAKPTERVQNKLPVEWELTNGGRGSKYGWVPMATNTTSQPQITFDFTEPARYASFTLFYMRSYGDKWANATATVTVQTPNEDGSGWQTVGDATLSGIHEKKTSETYTETIPLRNTLSSPLRVRFQLVGGSTFKVSGMAACQ